MIRKQNFKANLISLKLREFDVIFETDGRDKRVTMLRLIADENVEIMGKE